MRAWSIPGRTGADYPQPPALTTLDVTLVVPQINFLQPSGIPWQGFPYGKALVDNFAAIFEAYLTIDSDEVYTFTVGSDDGAMLNLTDSTGRARMVIDNGGVHGVVNKSGSVFLSRGVYHVRMARTTRSTVLVMERERERERDRDKQRRRETHETDRKKQRQKERETERRIIIYISHTRVIEVDVHGWNILERLPEVCLESVRTRICVQPDR